MLLNQVLQGHPHLDSEFRLLASSELKVLLPALTGVTDFQLHSTTRISKKHLYVGSTLWAAL